MSNQQSKNLFEGLRPLDLEDMVHPMFEVDTHRSKMGEDRDVCVLTFLVKDRAPAKDMMEFIEKGYSYVLDADVSAGENDKGEYSVFVELERQPKLAHRINEIVSGVNRLTGIDDWEFKFYKENKTYKFESDTLKNVVPDTPSNYDGLMTRIQVEGVKRFFNKTLMDDLTLDGNMITIHKPFNQKIQLRLVKEGATREILESSTAPQADADSMAEVFWLTKVMGDYNISKVAEGFTFENGDQTYILQRV